MDEYLRALHRRWLADQENPELSQEFAVACSRSFGVPSRPNQLEEILIDLLLAHIYDEGVDTFTNDATVKLLRLLFGEDAVNLYKKIVDDSQGRYFLDEETSQDFLDFLILKCGHPLDCDRHDVVCDVVGCSCPGCFDYPNLDPPSQVNLCYHHYQVAYVNPTYFLSIFKIY